MCRRRPLVVLEKRARLVRVVLLAGRAVASHERGRRGVLEVRKGLHRGRDDVARPGDDGVDHGSQDVLSPALRVRFSMPSPKYNNLSSSHHAF